MKSLLACLLGGGVLGMAAFFATPLQGAVGHDACPEYSLSGFRWFLDCPTNCTVRTCDFCKRLSDTSSKKCTLTDGFCEPAPEWTGSTSTKQCGAGEYYIQSPSCTGDHNSAAVLPHPVQLAVVLPLHLLTALVVGGELPEESVRSFVEWVSALNASIPPSYSARVEEKALVRLEPDAQLEMVRREYRILVSGHGGWYTARSLRHGRILTGAYPRG